MAMDAAQTALLKKTSTAPTQPTNPRSAAKGPFYFTTLKAEVAQEEPFVATEASNPAKSATTEIGNKATDAQKTAKWKMGSTAQTLHIKDRFVVRTLSKFMKTAPTNANTLRFAKMEYSKSLRNATTATIETAMDAAQTALLKKTSTASIYPTCPRSAVEGPFYSTTFKPEIAQEETFVATEASKPTKNATTETITKATDAQKTAKWKMDSTAQTLHIKDRFVVRTQSKFMTTAPTNANTLLYVRTGYWKYLNNVTMEIK